MNSVKTIIFTTLILFFLLFSFSPTIFELSQAKNLTDVNREFVLEHNYYWPDFNLYLSKIRQGYEGSLTALEKYTSERHHGSLIQGFYVILGYVGRFLGLDPNFSYQLGRLIFSSLLLFVILLLTRYYFKSFPAQILAFLVVVVSGSFPRFYIDSQNTLQIGRYMEWWSNIDALQRITFIPHILFGQAVSFYLLYRLTLNIKHTTRNILFYCFFGNLIGLVFPPSLITLDGVLLLLILVQLVRKKILRSMMKFSQIAYGILNCFTHGKTLHDKSRRFMDRTDPESTYIASKKILSASKILIFILLTFPSLLYFFLITKQLPWSALVEFHKTHPMMIPFWEYILGTGPIFFLGIGGAVISIIRRDRKFQPLIFWTLTTFFFAILFTQVKEQSPLRFTQTGLFIPLGILGTYFFQSFSHFFGQTKKWEYKKIIIVLILALYIAGSLFMMKVSLDWQTTWITQKIRATIPSVPYPPQAMYPLKSWMDGIRYLRDNTGRNDIVMAEVTAGNYIPAYSGNTVYFGQANTVGYEEKQLQVDRFFKGEIPLSQASIFLKEGRIKYVFYALQEKEMAPGKNLTNLYPQQLLPKPVFSNEIVTIYEVNN